MDARAPSPCRATAPAFPAVAYGSASTVDGISGLVPFSPAGLGGFRPTGFLSTLRPDGYPARRKTRSQRGGGSPPRRWDFLPTRWWTGHPLGSADLARRTQRPPVLMISGDAMPKKEKRNRERIQLPGQRPPPKAHSGMDGLQSKSPKWRLCLDGLAIFLSVLSLVLWLPSFAPNVHLDHRGPLDQKQPFSASFSITNNGLSTIFDVDFDCIVNKLEARNLALEIIGVTGFVFAAAKMDRSDTFDFVCPLRNVFGEMIDNLETISADIDIVVGFTLAPHFLRWRSYKCAHFVAQLSNSGRLEWLQRPQPDKKKCRLLMDIPIKR